MVLSKFVFRLGLRTVLILVNLVLIAYAAVYAELLYTPLVLAVLALIQMLDLWRFVRRTNEDLSRFLQAIQSRDFSVRFSQDEVDPSEVKLHTAFHLILDRIQESELERQAQYLYLKSVVENIPAGILALNEKDEIDLINPEAAGLLNIAVLSGAQRVKTFANQIPLPLMRLEHGESRLLEVQQKDGKKQLSASLYIFRLKDQKIRLYTLKNIASEIDQKELEAWVKLTRVLTHEIMNSVTPLLSLTETMTSILTNEKGNSKKLHELSDETIEDLLESLYTIRERSRGLLQFVDDYKKFTRIPELRPEHFVLEDLLSSMLQLMNSEFVKAGITIQFFPNPAPMLVYADRALLEQVFINLFTNAMQALTNSENPKLELSTHQLENRVEVKIKDNGCGIEPDKIEQIFIPFFSTKKDGSGIGLSLSRQIIHKHKGSISVISEKDKFTELTVRLPLARTDQASSLA